MPALQGWDKGTFLSKSTPTLVAESLTRQNQGVASTKLGLCLKGAHLPSLAIKAREIKRIKWVFDLLVIFNSVNLRTFLRKIFLAQKALKESADSLHHKCTIWNIHVPGEVSKYPLLPTNILWHRLEKARIQFFELPWSFCLVEADCDCENVLSHR